MTYTIIEESEMPTVEQVGKMWVHPNGQVRYYVDDFREITGIDAPKQVKVWMDRFGDIHVPYCDDERMKVDIIRAMDKYMRGDRKVVGTNTSNCRRMFTVYPGWKHNTMSYDNIESAEKRILTLRKAGCHVYRIQRTLTKGCECYSIYMDSSVYYDGRYGAGYQEMDSLGDGEVWMYYHGEDYRRDV